MMATSRTPMSTAMARIWADGGFIGGIAVGCGGAMARIWAGGGVIGGLAVGCGDVCVGGSCGKV